jgi:hypothetical protein
MKTNERETVTVVLVMLVLIAFVENAGDPPSRWEAMWETAASAQHSVALARRAEIHEFWIQAVGGVDCFAVVGWLAAFGAMLVF